MRREQQEAAIHQLTFRVRLNKLDVGWNDTVLQGQNGLDEAIEPRRSLAMADIRFDRANVNASIAKYAANGRRLDNVSDGCAGSMTLQVNHTRLASSLHGEAVTSALQERYMAFAMVLNAPQCMQSGTGPGQHLCKPCG